MRGFGAWLGTRKDDALSAAWFWHRAGCSRLADLGDVDTISDLINIGRQTAKEGDADAAKQLKDRQVAGYRLSSEYYTFGFDIYIWIDDLT